jgi:hypothetical protein
LKGSRPAGDEAKAIAKQLRDWFGKEIGAIAKPKDIRFGDNHAKTRSGKIMRRLLRSAANGEKINQDPNTPARWRIPQSWSNLLRPTDPGTEGARRARVRRGIPAQADLRADASKARSAGHSHNPANVDQLAQSN